jgi:hypothetical protein
VPGAFVRLQEEDFPRARYDAVIDASSAGTVTFSRVVEGRFTIEVSDVFGRGGRGGGKILADGAEVTVTVGMAVTGSVTGRFFMPDGTTPIPFGRVRLFQGGGFLPVGQATTDGVGELGRFKFDYVPAGDVRIEAQDPLTGRSGVATGRIVDEGHALTLNVIAQAVGTVTGIVTSNNAPKSGALVNVHSGAFGAQATTDVNGRYVVRGVPEGRITVTASLELGFLSASGTGTIGSENQELVIDIALKQTGVITGRVLSADGVTPGPISVVTVRPFQAYTDLYRVTTGTDGVYTFDRVPAGYVTLEARVVGSTDQATKSFNVIGLETNTVDLVLNGVGTLTGTTLDSNNQPVAANIYIRGTGAYPHSAYLTTGADGKFRLPEVLAGPFTISIAAEVGGVELRGQAAGSVAPGLTTNLDVKLQDTGTVTGIVRRADGTTAAGGADVTIRIAGRTDKAYAQVQADGTFTAIGVPLGQLSVYVADSFVAGYVESLGHELAANGEIENVGTLILDEGAMRVVATVPVDGATGLSQAGPVKVTFSHPLLDDVGIYVTDAGGAAVDLFTTFSADRRTVTLSGALPFGQVSIVADTTVTDMFGRHPAAVFTASFVTGDTTLPNALSVTPHYDHIQIPVTTHIVATFDEPLSTFNLENIIKLFHPGGGRVTGTSTLDGAVVTFVPDAPLQQNARYSYTVYGARDLANNAQLLPLTGGFWTIDTVEPTMTLTSPANNTSFVPRPRIRVRATDATSGVNFLSAELYVDNAIVPHIWSGDSIYYDPQISLLPGTHTVMAKIKDRALNEGTLSTSFNVILTPATIRVTYVTFSGTPVTNSSVTLTTSGGATQTRSVDANGQATFTNVPPGAFSIYADPSICCRNDTRVDGFVSDEDMGQTVDVIVRASPENVALRVRVFAGDGITPLPNIHLQVPGVWLDEGETARTDENGVFVRQFSPIGGQVDVTAIWSAPGSERVETRHTSAFASADGEAVNVDITLPVSVVRGSVRYASSDPVEFWTATAVQTIGSRTTTYTARGAAGGAPENYVIFGPLTGPFTVTAQDQNSTLIGTANGLMGDVATPVSVDVNLEPFGAVTGIVRDTSNVPVAGAEVAIVAGPTGSTRYAYTDADGRYRHEQVPLGAFSVMVSFEGYLRATVTGTVQTSGETVPLDIAFGPTAIVRGTLRNAANVPVPYTSVYATINGMADAAYAYTDENGVYELPNVALGTVTVVAGNSTAARGTVTLQTPGEIITLDLTLPATGVVTGIVTTSAGQPVPYRYVALESAGLRYPSYAFTDVQGRYRIDVAPVGPFTLTLYANGEIDRQVTGSIGTADETVTVDITLPPTGVVTGVVRDRSGAILPYIEVRVTAGNGMFQTNADQNGRYRVEQVRLGPVTVTARQEFWNASTTVSGTLEGTAEPLTLDVLISGTTRVTGTVRNEEGDLASSFYVMLDSPALPYRITASPLAQGQFTFEMLPPGPFTLTAVEPNLRLIGTYTGVASAEGGALSVDLAFTSGRVTGTVFGADGVTPSPGALVHFIGSGTSYEPRIVTVVANAAGVYEMPRLPTGTFTLRAYASNGVAAASATAAITAGGTTTIDFTLTPR